jgi:hypothetical protein
MGSQAKICSGNSLAFQAQIEDLRLKWCILGKNSKNSITGSNPHSSYRAIIRTSHKVSIREVYQYLDNN